MGLLGREEGGPDFVQQQEIVEDCSLFTDCSYLGDRAKLQLAVADGGSHRMQLGTFRLAIRKTFHHHYSVLRVEQTCTGHQRWDGAHQASAVQSHSQCDLILVISHLQGEGWTRDPRGPFINTPQIALLGQPAI